MYSSVSASASAKEFMGRPSPYASTWDEFHAAALRIFREQPYRTRCVTKWRHCDGKLELKVTDDAKVVKYKTTQAADLNKVERLNTAFLAAATLGPEALDDPAAGAAAAGAAAAPPPPASAGGQGQGTKRRGRRG